MILDLCFIVNVFIVANYYKCSYIVIFVHVLLYVGM